jgi:hypothetical protein
LPSSATQDENHEEKKDSNSKNKNNISQERAKNTPADAQKIILNENPIDFSITLQSNSVFENKKLSPVITIQKFIAENEHREATVNYSILDSRGDSLYLVSEKTNLSAGKEITKDITLPSHIKAGFYKLKIEIQNDKFSSSKEIAFEIIPAPIINLGGGIIVTYPDILSSLGTISLSLFALLIIWLFLFSREYWLSLHAIRNITENNLAKMGLISLKRKIK